MGTENETIMESYKERCKRYEQVIGLKAPQVFEGEKLYGMFEIGNYYAGNGYYGSYPGNYMQRMMVLFPEHPRLHLFSGQVKDMYATKVDYDKEMPADIHCEITEFLRNTNKKFKTVFADPPYGKEEAENYNAPYPDKRECMRLIPNVLEPGGHLIWLDTRRPNWARDDGWEWAGCIGVDCGTQRIARFASIFRKPEEREEKGNLFE